MQNEYNPDTLNDYKTYRRECRNEGITRPMDFEAFEFQWNKEASLDARSYERHITSMRSQERYI